MKKQTIYGLTAIEIGIGSKNWDFKNEGAPIEECISFMREKKYDILPLKNDRSKYEKFWVTSQWNNYDEISLQPISSLPKLNAGTTFKSLLSAFINDEQKKFFLLYKGASIVGLVSIVNFSYREIYKRLYNLLSEMETQIADWVFNQIDQKEALDLLIRKSQSSISKSTLGQYLIDKHIGNDSHIKEYLYLSSLHNLIKQKSLYIKLGFSKKEWDNISDPLFETRNAVAHPVKSIIRERKDFQRIYTTLEAAERIMSVFNN